MEQLERTAMHRVVAMALVSWLLLGATPATGHLKGRVTASTRITEVNRTENYVRVRGRAKITNNRPSPGPIPPRPSMCEVQAWVEDGGSGWDWVGLPPPGRTATRRWEISIPVAAGHPESRPKARVAHCH